MMWSAHIDGVFGWHGSDRVQPVRPAYLILVKGDGYEKINYEQSGASEMSLLRGAKWVLFERMVFRSKEGNNWAGKVRENRINSESDPGAEGAGYGESAGDTWK